VDVSIKEKLTGKFANFISSFVKHSSQDVYRVLTKANKKSLIALRLL